MLRSDWRGEPVRLRKGFQFVSRANAAARYNKWLETDQPHFRWSRFRLNSDGVREVNITPQVDEEYFGIGGEPGWLGWGAIPEEDLLKWVHEGHEDVLERLAQRERYQEKTFGLQPIVAQPLWMEKAESIRRPAANRTNRTETTRRGAGPGGRETETSEAYLKAFLETHRQADPIAAVTAVGKPGRLAWTPEEDRELIRLQAAMGSAWTKIADRIPGRTKNAVKNRFEKLSSRGLSAGTLPAGAAGGGAQGEGAPASPPATTQVPIIDEPITAVAPTPVQAAASAKPAAPAGAAAPAVPAALAEPAPIDDDAGDEAAAAAAAADGGARDGGGEEALRRHLNRVIRARREEIRELMGVPEFAGLNRSEMLRLVATWDAAVQQDPEERTAARLALVPDAQVEALERDLLDCGLDDTLGLKPLLRSRPRHRSTATRPRRPAKVGDGTPGLCSPLQRRGMQRMPPTPPPPLEPTLFCCRALRGGPAPAAFSPH